MKVTPADIERAQLAIQIYSSESPAEKIQIALEQGLSDQIIDSTVMLMHLVNSDQYDKEVGSHGFDSKNIQNLSAFLAVDKRLFGRDHVDRVNFARNLAGKYGIEMTEIPVDLMPEPGSIYYKQPFNYDPKGTFEEIVFSFARQKHNAMKIFTSPWSPWLEPGNSRREPLTQDDMDLLKSNFRENFLALKNDFFVQLINNENIFKGDISRQKFVEEFWAAVKQPECISLAAAQSLRAVSRQLGDEVSAQMLDGKIARRDAGSEYAFSGNIFRSETFAAHPLTAQEILAIPYLTNSLPALFDALSGKISPIDVGYFQELDGVASRLKESGFSKEADFFEVLKQHPEVLEVLGQKTEPTNNFGMEYLMHAESVAFKLEKANMKAVASIIRNRAKDLNGDIQQKPNQKEMDHSPSM